MNNVRKAAQEYLLRRGSYIKLRELDNGFFAPPANDTCPLCKDAQWSCKTGAHLKTLEHTALKHGVTPKTLMNALDKFRWGPGAIAYKSLSYTPSSYLRSANDFIWLPGEVSEAQCDDPECETPGDMCGCGLYFFWSPIKAIQYYGDIIVKCEIGGKIEECTDGCRAQYAVIRGIVEAPENQEWQQEMSQIYEVPLVNIWEDDNES